ncbi:MAG: AIR synthase-related protein, partial [Oscillospiraceae bacterium]
EVPNPSDVVILLGGRTGRDGCGGATGSSKSHTEASLEHCGAEVQKGNAPVERKLQRLFRNADVTRMIKRCNDFGAGGVSVAIGELTDGLIINLDKVPKKYNGLDGTELAISESQERMAVVVEKENIERFMKAAADENLEASLVAVVTEEPRLRMQWNDKEIVNLSREFLNSNGAEKHTDVNIPLPLLTSAKKYIDAEDSWSALLENLNVCSQKGLAERFDSTIGAGTVLMPFGGKHQLTPTQAMAAKIPVLHGETTSCSLMGWGFNPYISDKSPYHGAMLAVIESIAKVVAIGGTYKNCWLTFQEYFERTNNNPTRWGKPFAALLGAYKAQVEMGCGAIGGKDSMSGTFENIDVPPTLVSFAVSMANSQKIISPEFKKAGHKVIYITPKYDENKLPLFDSVKECFDKVEKLIADKKARAAWAIGFGGVAEAIAKMSFGNKIGFKFTEKLDATELFSPIYGAFVVELKKDVETDERVIGETTAEYSVDCINYSVSLDVLQEKWENRLEPVYPCKVKIENPAAKIFTHTTSFRL